MGLENYQKTEKKIRSRATLARADVLFPYYMYYDQVCFLNKLLCGFTIVQQVCSLDRSHNFLSASAPDGAPVFSGAGRVSISAFDFVFFIFLFIYF